ncbi:MAG: hypothetical protein HZB99_01035 [Candidatus Harrisonbacteria bacterium]|nr:hypothetical protein [Candidatus Harrisonbacteria bacterium]
MNHSLLPRLNFLTSTVGSFPQPEELRKARVMLKCGAIREEEYRLMVRDHTLRWIRLQEELNVDILVTGEFERQDMAVFFGEQFSGSRLEDFVPSYENRRYRPVNYVGNVCWQRPIALPMYSFMKENTGRLIKETITGPVTLFDWGLRGNSNYYYSPDLLRKDLVAALRQEMISLREGGVKILQIDEPAFTTKPRELEKEARAISDLVSGFENDFYLILHICYSTEEDLDRAFPLMLQMPFDQIHIEMANRNYGLLRLIEKHGFGDKDIGLGVIDVHADRIETPEEILDGIEKTLRFIPPERIWITPDCGLKERSKEVTLAKLKVMVEASKRARELF